MFEETLRGDDVVARVAVALVPPARPDPGLAGEVVNDVGAIQRGGEVGVHQVQLLERKIAMTPGHLQVLVLLGAPVVVGEAVDAHDFLAVGQKTLREVGADETRRARYHRLHTPQAETPPTPRLTAWFPAHPPFLA